MLKEQLQYVLALPYERRIRVEWLLQMRNSSATRSNAAEIDVAEEDVGKDEDEFEDKAVKLDTSVKVSSGRWVTSAGTLERPDWRLRPRATCCAGIGPLARDDRSIALLAGVWCSEHIEVGHDHSAVLICGKAHTTIAAHFDEQCQTSWQKSAVCRSVYLWREC
ncbi:hypothetical protein T069G_04424 [Trichoderma breve]|uniref:Uncharacterized protein n=1 Tax=Trichoderma breve TaxID=2034170 RepID=A0A9W9EB48_9HYPO|nr:hypothetical protein T069G_04424 [Trichoderma breve]KAJ4863470.1 hypothetical protein T069G_04424 [Trichoderma breve]